MITTLPLSALLLSDLNVRKTERDADIAALAEDIAACGLKQNLVVVPAHFMTSKVEEEWDGQNRWENKFEVIAGGRRYQALRLLANDGRIEPDHPVPVLVESRDEATRTSLSENLHRVAMNPADEFEAFSKIVHDQQCQGESAADAAAWCAKRFGVTVRHVDQRLRLAALAPEVLGSLRTGAITLDSAKAYAGTADHELQLKVFAEQAKSNWKPHDPGIVRDALRQRSLSLNDRLVKFVTLEAYRAAGGRTEVDLFMGTAGEERLIDVKLLEKLARDQAEPLVAPRAKKDGFASGLLAAPGSNKWPAAPAGMERFVRYYQDKDPTKAELKKRVAVYGIDADGLDLIGHFHTPAPAAAVPTANRYVPETEEQRAARTRSEQIDFYVGQLAGKRLVNTLLGADHVYWPEDRYDWVDPVVTDPEEVAEAGGNEDEVLVATVLRIKRANLEAYKDEATRIVEAELANLEAAKAKPAANRAARAADTDAAQNAEAEA